jgi:hypothetical protein
MRLVFYLLIPTMVVCTLASWAVLDGMRAHRALIEADIKACNRQGGIFTEGTCQHVFSPICRRTLDCPRYPKRL